MWGVHVVHVGIVVCVVLLCSVWPLANTYTHTYTHLFYDTAPTPPTSNVPLSSSNTSRNIRIGVGTVVGGGLLLVLLVLLVVFTVVHVKKGKRRSKRVLNYNTVYGELIKRQLV